MSAGEPRRVARTKSAVTTIGLPQSSRRAIDGQGRPDRRLGDLGRRAIPGGRCYSVHQEWGIRVPAFECGSELPDRYDSLDPAPRLRLPPRPLGELPSRILLVVKVLALSCTDDTANK